MWQKFIWIPIILITLFLFVPEEMILFVQGMIILGFTISIGIGSLWVMSWYEDYKIKKAERLTKEMQGRFIVTPSGVWNVAHPKWDIVRLTDSPFIRNNGHDRPLTDDEYKFMLSKTAPKIINSVPQLISGEEKEEQKLDLINVFTQPTQSYAIIGGQQTGKTFQAQHIANYWIEKGTKPLVIGPKWDKGEWQGCFLMGGDGDYQKVEAGIKKVMGLASKRHADKVFGHKDHPIQPIFFDDWTPVVQNAQNAESLITSATVMYASVNIILYFIIHADTAPSWGVDKIGAALKNNFIKLRIIPAYDQNGMIIRNQTKGYVRFAGEDIDRPVELINSPLMLKARTVEVPVSKAASEREIILEMLAEGKSYRAISSAVWGKVGTFYNGKIDNIAKGHV